MALGHLQAASGPVPAGSTSFVVRADAASGRLVRTIVVPPREERIRLVSSGDAASFLVSAVPQFIEETARRHNLDPLLVHSVIQVESNYNPYAVSPKGAEGLMQLIPSTARRFGVKNAFIPQENVEGGVRYLKHLLTLFNDERLALAAYNAGEEAVSRHGGVPPYRETIDYVDKVSKKYGEARKASAGSGVGTALGGDPASGGHRPIEAFVDREGKLHIRTR